MEEVFWSIVPLSRHSISVTLVIANSLQSVSNWLSCVKLRERKAQNSHSRTTQSRPITRTQPWRKTGKNNICSTSSTTILFIGPGGHIIYRTAFWATPWHQHLRQMSFFWRGVTSRWRVSIHRNHLNKEAGIFRNYRKRYSTCRAH